MTIKSAPSGIPQLDRVLMDGVPRGSTLLVLGTTGGNRVELLRPAAGTMRMIGVGGTNNEGLDWDFDTAGEQDADASGSSDVIYGINAFIKLKNFSLKFFHTN